jgi:hypothetical protein
MIMIEPLTLEDILKGWVFVGNTEANGKHYHDLSSDRSAVVYREHTRVFSNRREGIKGNFPAAYNDVDVIIK